MATTALFPSIPRLEATERLDRFVELAVLKSIVGCFNLIIAGGVLCTDPPVENEGRHPAQDQQGEERLFVMFF